MLPSWRQFLLKKLVLGLWHCLGGADLPAWVSASAREEGRSLVACCLLPRCFSQEKMGISCLFQWGTVPKGLVSPPAALGAEALQMGGSSSPGGKRRHRRGESHTHINLLLLWTWTTTFLTLIWVCDSHTGTQSVPYCSNRIYTDEVY